MAAGVRSSRGGDLLRRLGGWKAVAVVRRGREAYAGDEPMWIECLGRPGRPLAPILGLHAPAVYKAAQRGAAQAREWRRLI